MVLNVVQSGLSRGRKRLIVSFVERFWGSLAEIQYFGAQAEKYHLSRLDLFTKKKMLIFQIELHWIVKIVLD